jgi:colanic acid/amylovoran biosynthesis protein
MGVTGSKTILYAGAYGTQNAGDDLPLLVMKRMLDDRAAGQPRIHRVLAREVNAWDISAYGVKMIRNPEYSSRAESAGKWFRGLNFADSRWPMMRLSAEFRRCDLVILGAANWIIDLTLDTLRGPLALLALYVFLADLHQKPVLLYGLSAETLSKRWGKDLTHWIIRRATAVTVRDLWSSEYLSALTGRKDIEHLPDPVLGGAQPQASVVARISSKYFPPGRGKPWIAVGLRDLRPVLGPGTAEAVETAMCGAIQQLRCHYRFMFVPQSTYAEDDDRNVARTLASRLHNDVEYRIIEDRCHPEELIAIYSRCVLTMAVRLHAAVFSVVANTPVVAISYLQKVENFMQEIELPDFGLPAARLETADIVRVATTALHDTESLKKRMCKRFALLRARVDGYGDIAHRLLADRGISGHARHRTNKFKAMDG